MADIIVLTEWNDINFMKQKVIKFEVTADQVGRQMFFEASIKMKSQTSSTSPFFIMLVARNGAVLQDYYQVLFSYQGASQYKNSGIYIDLEAFATLRTAQLVQIPIILSTQVGTWQIGLYDLNQDGKLDHLLNFRIFSMSINEKYCPQTCSDKQNNQIAACNVQVSQITNLCDCIPQYIGEVCSYRAELIEKEQIIPTQIDPTSWVMRSFNASEYEKMDISLKLLGKIANVKLALVFGASSNIFVPNILENNYDINQSGEDWQEFPVISDKLQRLFDPNISKGASIAFPYRNKDFDKIIIIGFYNMSPSQPVFFNLQLSVSESMSSSLSNQNKILLILLIILSCVILLSIKPLIYYYIKKRKMQQDASNSLPHSNQQELDNGALPINPVSSQVVINPPQEALNVQADDNSKKRIVPITKETVNQFMPLQLHRDVMRLYPTLQVERDDCTVCLEGFEETSECRITPCFHLFHSECLLSWFLKHSTCPCCRNSCNRKGIIRQLQQKQTNSYVQRIQQPKSKNNLPPSSRQEELFSDPNCEDNDMKNILSKQDEFILTQQKNKYQSNLSDDNHQNHHKPSQKHFHRALTNEYQSHNDFILDSKPTEIQTQIAQGASQVLMNEKGYQNNLLFSLNSCTNRKQNQRVPTELLSYETSYQLPTNRHDQYNQFNFQFSPRSYNVIDDEDRSLQPSSNRNLQNYLHDDNLITTSRHQQYFLSPMHSKECETDRNNEDIDNEIQTIPQMTHPIIFASQKKIYELKETPKKIKESDNFIQKMLNQADISSGESENNNKQVPCSSFQPFILPKDMESQEVISVANTCQSICKDQLLENQVILDSNMVIQNHDLPISQVEGEEEESKEVVEPTMPKGNHLSSAQNENPMESNYLNGVQVINNLFVLSSEEDEIQEEILQDNSEITKESIFQQKPQQEESKNSYDEQDNQSNISPQQ